MLRLRFGPFAFELDRSPGLSALLAPFVDGQAKPVMTVARVARAGPFGPPGRSLFHPGLPERLLGPGFGAEVADAHAIAWLAPDAPPALALTALLEALLVHQATRAGHLVLHAGGLRLPDGAALLLGPSGVGKSTAVRQAGRAVFAYNAVLVDPGTGRAWPLPFTGKDDPPLDRIDPLPVRLVVRVHRSESEPVSAPLLARHVTSLEGDPRSADAIFAALTLFERVPRLGLHTSRLARAAASLGAPGPAGARGPELESLLRAARSEADPFPAVRLEPVR